MGDGRINGQRQQITQQHVGNKTNICVKQSHNYSKILDCFKNLLQPIKAFFSKCLCFLQVSVHAQPPQKIGGLAGNIEILEVISKELTSIPGFHDIPSDQKTSIINNANWLIQHNMSKQFVVDSMTYRVQMALNKNFAQLHSIAKELANDMKQKLNDTANKTSRLGEFIKTSWSKVREWRHATMKNMDQKNPDRATNLAGLQNFWVNGALSTLRCLFDKEGCGGIRTEEMSKQFSECPAGKATTLDNAAYLYALQQTMFYHMSIFPGYKEGNPPTVHLVRKISTEGLKKMLDLDANSPAEGNAICKRDKQHSAESYSILTEDKRNRDGLGYGGAAIYGDVPVYAIFSSMYTGTAQDQQREAVVLGLEDLHMHYCMDFSPAKVENHEAHIAYEIMKQNIQASIALK